MNRFFWCSFGDEITICEKIYPDRNAYAIVGSDEVFEASELVIGTEISFSKTGLLSALNDVK